MIEPGPNAGASTWTARVHYSWCFQIAGHPFARDGLEAGDVLEQGQSAIVGLGARQVWSELIDDDARKPFDLLVSERVQ